MSSSLIPQCSCARPTRHAGIAARCIRPRRRPTPSGRCWNRCYRRLVMRRVAADAPKNIAAE